MSIDYFDSGRIQAKMKDTVITYLTPNDWQLKQKQDQLELFCLTSALFNGAKVVTEYSADTTALVVTPDSNGNLNKYQNDLAVAFAVNRRELYFATKDQGLVAVYDYKGLEEILKKKS